MSRKKSPDAVVRAVEKLLKAKETLSESIEQAILRHGAAAIDPLIEVMKDYEVESYAPMHAARLLGKLKAEAAVGPMIDIVVATDWDDMLHNAAILALGEIGQAVVEPILARVSDFPVGDDDVRPALVGALASCGAKDERIYQLLLNEFEVAAWRTAGELAAYGDERAIPVICKALDESRFGVDREHLAERAVIDLCDSIEELGGELSPAQQERVDQVRGQLRARYDKRTTVKLSADDAELSDFLDSNEDAMTLAEAMGFLTAIVSGPTTTMPSVWLEVVLGEKPGFESRDHANHILGLVMNLHNRLISSLNEGTPVSPSEPDEDVQDWCVGYVEAAKMDSVWMADETALDFLFPMSILSGDFSLVGETDFEGKVIEDPTPQENACRARLDKTAHEAYRYWLAWGRSHSTTPVVRKAPKVGRNESCPCGSGKKFKKCCDLTN